ncbi:MAG: DEAD/DEAH box helicase [Acidimicrobiia bacterium]|nr:DEAD/DEAH box helicase [Acidimicrobiia bacterium]
MHPAEPETARPAVRGTSQEREKHVKTHFETLGVSPDLAAALAADGITEAFPIQSLALPDALAGRDVCGKAKTGSGKTLAFGLPLLERVSKASAGHPTGLVLVPTRELAKQVRGVLAPLGKVRSRRCRAVYGGVPADKQIRSLATGVDVVVGTPGRIIDLVAQGHMALDAVEVLVVDEADRMADMGFMPQVQKILYRITGPHQTMLFSATLDGAVDRLVKRYLTDPVFHEVVSPEVTVDAMDHHFFLVHQMDKVRVAAAIARGAGRTLIFTRTKRGADRLVEQLRREGIRAGAIHGDLRQSARERALADFASGKLPTLVATDVAARGIHIDDVDVVVHYDPPEDEKAYLHRSGRTARAGAAGVTVTLQLWNQENEIRVIQRRLRLEEPIVEIFSNDPRLGELSSGVGATGAAVAG